MDNYYKIHLNLARNSLRVLVNHFKISKLFLPFYICPTVKNILKQENVETVFYHIDDNFFPIGDFENEDFILYPNYFGVCSKNIEILEKKYKSLIVDNAQAFFMLPKGLASFNSPRKFFFQSFGLKDGSELFIKDVENIFLNYPKDDFEYETIENNFSYDSFLKNEKRLEEQKDIKQISSSSFKILNSIDFEKEKVRRLNKFYTLNEKYSSRNELKFELSKNDVPFVYPLLTFDEDLAKNVLKEYDYILRYWTNLPKNFNEYKLYKNLLPLPL